MKKRLLIFLLVTIPCCAGLRAQIITTLVGNGTSGHSGDGGPATAAILTNPFGIAVDSRGNVYVAEYSDYVRKIDHKGIITTIAGSGVSGPLGDGGPATAAYIASVTDLAFDAADNLYIVDQGNGRIRKVDQSGIITTVAGGGAMTFDGVPATAAQLLNPTGIAIDPSGNIYIAIGVRVRKVEAATGKIITIAGNGTKGHTGDGGPAPAASITEAYDVAVDKAGNVYFSDWKDYTIRQVNTAGIINTIAGQNIGSGGYVGDNGPASACLFNSPWGITIDKNDNIYICDVYNNCVRKINSLTSIITTVAGSGWTGVSGDGGPATAAACGTPNVAVDCGGNLFLTGNLSRARKVTYIYDPAFVSTDSVIVCENYPAHDIDTLLTSNDVDHALAIDWTVDVAPAHGSVGGAGYSMLTTGANVIPSGLTYTPAPGYIGIDSFTMQVAYCNQVADWRKVYVRVKPSPVVAAISSVDTLCIGLSATPTNATPGGVWAVTNANMTMSGSLMTAITTGVDTIIYTVTGANACSTKVSRGIVTGYCAEGVKRVDASSMISVYPSPANNLIHIDGLNVTARYRLLSAIGKVMTEGTLNKNKSEISLSGIASGVYVLEVTDPSSGLSETRRIIKE